MGSEHLDELIRHHILLSGYVIGWVVYIVLLIWSGD